MTTYPATVEWLQRLEVARGWDLKLERVHAALERLGRPERAFAAVHVAGTNGKGSTAAMVEAVLRAAGRRTGLYTSPHLVDFAERIRAGGRTIPQEAVVALTAEIRRVVELAGIALTHFEFVSVLAFTWFARIGVEIAVVEVGLGGRLDATNVLAPRVTAVTSVGFDHEEWLGRTLAAIAAEKAGIAKAGVPLVVGDLPAEAAGVVAARAAAVGAPLVRVGTEARLAEAPDGLVFEGPGGVCWTGLRLGLAGDHQRANAAVALGLLAVLGTAAGIAGDAVRHGLATVDWPGRLAVVREAPRVVIDGAHNADGAAALARALPGVLGRRPTTLVVAVVSDKDWRSIVEALLPFVRRVCVTAVGHRALAPTVVAEAVAGRVPTAVVPDAVKAIAGAVAAAAPDEAVLVAGSLFLAGAAYAALGVTALAPPWQGWGASGTDRGT